ncbi:glucosyltransferase domain-containing protein [Pantoea anthophila]|uniref:glucosyltransferase domain-containing protein n=1 Tax=Pantoea anthophila TaxID=470931 RepID=UPI003015DB99
MNKYFFEPKEAMQQLFFSLFFCIIAYGFSLSNHTISIDVDVMDNYLHTIDLGRWGHAILKRFVFHEPWIPFFSLAFSLICLSASSAIVSSYLQLSKINSLIFSALFVTFPQMAYQLQFSNQAETVGLALLACCYSVLLYSRQGIKTKIAFILINIFVISIYQSFTFLPVTLIALYHLKKANDGNGTLRSWFLDSVIVSVLTVIAVSVYFLISKQIKAYYHINDVSYFSALISWGKIGFIEAIIGVYKFILYQCYIATWYGFNLYFLSAVAIAAIAIRSMRNGANHFLTTIILSIVVILSPFILNILIGAGTPARTLSQLPLVFAATIAIAMQNVRKESFKVLVTIAIALSSCAYINILFYSDKVSDEQTHSLSEMIMNDMYRTYPDTARRETPVYFYGKLSLRNPWKPSGADEFGISFYERGESDRIGNYIRNTGLANILQVGKYDVNNEQKEAIKIMPEWPTPGYIKEVDGKVLIKMSN